MTPEEEPEGCTWQVGGNYLDTPPEYCELESDGEYCPKHTAMAAAMAELDTPCEASG